MQRLTMWLSAAALVLAVGTLAGCGPTKNAVQKPQPGKTKTDDHAGEHPMHGPNGGHVAELDSASAPGKEDYHAEWLTDDASGKVTVILLDADVKKEVGSDAEELTIDVKTQDKTEPYQLKAANRTEGDLPTASRFESTDNTLVTILSGDAIDATIRVKIKGEEFSGKIVPHKH